jgi:hypothetical protein
MENKLDLLKKELKIYEDLRAQLNEFSEENSEIYNKWDSESRKLIRQALVKDGIANDENDIRVNFKFRYEKSDPHAIEVTVIDNSNPHRREIRFDYVDEKVIYMTSTGFSSSSKNLNEAIDSLEPYCSYFEMALRVTSTLKTGLPLTTKVLKNIKDPVYPKWNGMNANEINEKIIALTSEITICDLDLSIGAEVELFIPAKGGRWYSKGSWNLGEVTSVTSKNVIVNCNNWNYRIAKGDVEDRLRKPGPRE